jgi:hypothetical protein
VAEIDARPSSKLRFGVFRYAEARPPSTASYQPCISSTAGAWLTEATRETKFYIYSTEPVFLGGSYFNTMLTTGGALVQSYKISGAIQNTQNKLPMPFEQASLFDQEGGKKKAKARLQHVTNALNSGRGSGRPEYDLHGRILMLDSSVPLYEIPMEHETAPPCNATLIRHNWHFAYAMHRAVAETNEAQEFELGKLKGAGANVDVGSFVQATPASPSAAATPARGQLNIRKQNPLKFSDPSVHYAQSYTEVSIDDLRPFMDTWDSRQAEIQTLYSQNGTIGVDLPLRISHFVRDLTKEALKVQLVALRDAKLTTAVTDNITDDDFFRTYNPQILCTFNNQDQVAKDSSMVLPGVRRALYYGFGGQNAKTSNGAVEALCSGYDNLRTEQKLHVVDSSGGTRLLESLPLHPAYLSMRHFKIGNSADFYDPTNKNKEYGKLVSAVASFINNRDVRVAAVGYEGHARAFYKVGDFNDPKPTLTRLPTVYVLDPWNITKLHIGKGATKHKNTLSALEYCRDNYAKEALSTTFGILPWSKGDRFQGSEGSCTLHGLSIALRLAVASAGVSGYDEQLAVLEKCAKMPDPVADPQSGEAFVALAMLYNQRTRLANDDDEADDQRSSSAENASGDAQ